MSLFNKNHAVDTPEPTGERSAPWRVTSSVAVAKSIAKSLDDVDLSIAEIARTVAERPKVEQIPAAFDPPLAERPKVEQIPAAFDPPLAEPYLIFEKTYDGAYSIRFDLKTTDSDRAFEALEAIQKIIIANKTGSK